MRIYAKRSKEIPSAAHKAQQPSKSPQAGATASSLLTRQASSVRLPPVLGAPVGVLGIQQLKGNRAVSQMSAAQHTAAQETAQVVQQHPGVLEQQRKRNNTGMSDELKTGIESLSGIDMSDVRVYYNSSQPIPLKAYAYAQGNQIHIAPGQEKYLAHEAWHVAQQKQGRVEATRQMEGQNINDDACLEREADIMGKRAEGADVKAEVVGTKMIRANASVAQLTPSKIVNKTIRYEDKEKIKDTERSKAEQAQVSQPVNGFTYNAPLFDPCTFFHAGHLIARHFGGDATKDNLVPMPETLDENTYKINFENKVDLLVNALTSGRKIELKVTASFDDTMAEKLIEPIVAIARLDPEKKLSEKFVQLLTKTMQSIPDTISASFNDNKVYFKRPDTYPDMKFNGSKKNVAAWVDHMDDVIKYEARKKVALERELTASLLPIEERMQKNMDSKIDYHVRRLKKAMKQEKMDVVEREIEKLKKLNVPFDVPGLKSETESEIGLPQGFEVDEKKALDKIQEGKPSVTEQQDSLRLLSKNPDKAAVIRSSMPVWLKVLFFAVGVKICYEALVFYNSTQGE